MSFYILSETGRIGIPGETGFLIYDLGGTPPPTPGGITFANRTISMPVPPWRWQVEPVPLRTVNVTLTGQVETICAPSMETRITGEFHLIEDPALRAELHNLWQWASRGRPWSWALDVTRTVDTTLTAYAAPGSTTIQVYSADGIEAGRTYRLFHGPNYQLVTIESIAGLTLTLTESLDMEFGGIDGVPEEYRAYNAHLRDEYYYIGAIRDADADMPIIDVEAGEVKTAIPQRWFRTKLEFYESTR